MSHAAAARARSTRPGGRLTAHQAGPATVLLLAVAYAATWWVAKPAGEPTWVYLGQLLGAESMLLLSVALVLISALPWVEQWFAGIDHAAIWHRGLALAGIALVVPHALLTSTPAGHTTGRALALGGTFGLSALAVWSVLPRWRTFVPAPLHRFVLRIRDVGGIRHLRRWLGGYERWRAVQRLTGLFVAAGFVHGLLDATATGRPGRLGRSAP
ncbi:hypothetical protein [Dactylosporangium sp. CA-139066]|uniref:hypothetical protein n=1 Tax=Dactylosporangium sp. CA-139066 TaxID=3239930 RepID=UPI003D8A8A60